MLIGLLTKLPLLPLKLLSPKRLPLLLGIAAMLGAGATNPDFFNNTISFITTFKGSSIGDKAIEDLYKSGKEHAQGIIDQNNEEEVQKELKKQKERKNRLEKERADIPWSNFQEQYSKWEEIRGVKKEIRALETRLKLIQRAQKTQDTVKTWGEILRRNTIHYVKFTWNEVRNSTKESEEEEKGKEE